MMTSYKDQFTEWSPAYPAFVHTSTRRKYPAQEWVDFENVSNSSKQATIRTHKKVINAINKAMKK